MHLSKKATLAVTASALVTIALAGCSNASDESAGSSSSGLSGTLSINSFGGSFQEAVQSNVVDTFTKGNPDTSVNVTTALGSEALSLLQSSAGNPELDVAYMDPVIVAQASAQGLVQKLDYSKIPNSDEVYDLAKGDYSVAELASMTGIVYNTECISKADAPTSWASLWNSKYAGKVAISAITGTAGYQFLAESALLNGGSETDIDPGFEAIKKLDPAVIYSTPDELGKLLTSGEACVGVGYADRTAALKASGAPVEFVQPSEGAIAVLSSMAIAEGTKVPDLAYAYIDHQLDADVNKSFVMAISEGPTNSKVELDEDFLAENYLPYGEDEINSLVQLDNDAIAENLADWTSRWQQEIVAG